MTDRGGEAACWLDRVCPECGALNDDAQATRQDCWRCGWRPSTPEDPDGGRACNGNGAGGCTADPDRMIVLN